MQVSINLKNVYSGIWTLRITGQNVINGEFNAYLPNKNLISDNTRFIDSDSNSTITRYGLLREVITIGTYNTKSNIIWIGSSKGPAETLDMVAPGVDIISNYLDNTFNTATGTGVSSSVVCGVIALLIEFIINLIK